jgi:hypothetical protein
MQKPSPRFPDQPGCFSGKWRFISQGVEIIKDEISCLIRFSQDLQNWMDLPDFVSVHGFKGSGVQGCILVPELHLGCVFARKASASSDLIQNLEE